MPFVLVAIGLLLIIVAVRNNQDSFYAQLAKDFLGQGNFTLWIAAIVVLGSLGYYKPIKPAVDLFLLLMLVAFFLSNHNQAAFEQLLPTIQNAFSNAHNVVAPAAPANATAPGSPLGSPLAIATPPAGSLPNASGSAASINNILHTAPPPNSLDALQTQWDAENPN